MEGFARKGLEKEFLLVSPLGKSLPPLDSLKESYAIPVSSSFPDLVAVSLDRKGCDCNMASFLS